MEAVVRASGVEQDPKKLLELTKQINDLLLGKQDRLEQESGQKSNE